MKNIILFFLLFLFLQSCRNEIKEEKAKISDLEIIAKIRQKIGSDSLLVFKKYKTRFIFCGNPPWLNYKLDSLNNINYLFICLGDMPIPDEIYELKHLKLLTILTSKDIHFQKLPKRLKKIFFITHQKRIYQNFKNICISDSLEIEIEIEPP